VPDYDRYDAHGNYEGRSVERSPDSSSSDSSAALGCAAAMVIALVLGLWAIPFPLNKQSAGVIILVAVIAAGLAALIWRRPLFLFVRVFLRWVIPTSLQVGMTFMGTSWRGRFVLLGICGVLVGAWLFGAALARMYPG
jgi:hypothetical protein